MKISFVIPVYNEKDSLEELYNEIVAGVGSKTYEIIFIDDGSTDGSVNIIEQLAKMDSSVIVIQFYRNYGKSAALSEGCLLYTSPSPRDRQKSRMPSSP